MFLQDAIPPMSQGEMFGQFSTDHNSFSVFSIGEASSLVKKRGRDSCSLQRVKEKGNKGRQELHFADEHLCRPVFSATVLPAPLASPDLRP